MFFSNVRNPKKLGFMGMYWVCNPKKLGFYGYVLGIKPKKVWVLWVWVGYWVPYPIPTQKPNYFWVPMSVWKT